MFVLPIENDAVVLGLLAIILAVIFYTHASKNKYLVSFYKFVPALLLCYFIPAIFNSVGIIDGETSNLYFVASRYLLPASLVLLSLNIDLKGILGLGPKALIMFFAATIGIIVGGPIALWLVGSFVPDVFYTSSGEPLWPGLATVAGSWIGGGANQTAMKEIFGASDKLFSAMIVVDVFVANLWMAFLLYGAGTSDNLDKKLKADNTAIKALEQKMQNYSAK